MNQIDYCRHQEPARDEWIRDEHEGRTTDSQRWGRKRLAEVAVLKQMYYSYPWLATKSERRASANEPQTRFNVLADRWHDETAFLSSLTKKITHPAYLEIIGMGPSALPMVLKRLETDPGYWFTALRALSGHDPISADQRGNFRASREAWLTWGRGRGLL